MLEKWGKSTRIRGRRKRRAWKNCKRCNFHNTISLLKHLPFCLPLRKGKEKFRGRNFPWHWRMNQGAGVVLTWCFWRKIYTSLRGSPQLIICPLTSTLHETIPHNRAHNTLDSQVGFNGASLCFAADVLPYYYNFGTFPATGAVWYLLPTQPSRISNIDSISSLLAKLSLSCWHFMLSRSNDND